jgi:hypothetical protein
MRAPAHAQVEAEAKAKAEAARRAEEARLAEERAKEMRRQRIFNTTELGEYFEAADDVAEKMVRTGILRESAADDSDRQAWSSDDLGTDTSVDDVSAGKTPPPLPTVAPTHVPTVHLSRRRVSRQDRAEFVGQRRLLLQSVPCNPCDALGSLRAPWQVCRHDA